MGSTHHFVITGQFFFLLELTISGPGGWQIEESIPQHHCRPGDEVVMPCHVLQFVGEHRLKLALVKMLGHPG